MANPPLLRPLLISILLALVFSFVPLRGPAGFWRPLLLMLVVVYWLLAEPHRLGIGFAWLCGLLHDLLTGGIPGQQALALAVCAYVLQLSGQRLRHFSLWHHTVLVALLATLHQLVVVFVNLVLGRDAQHWYMFYAIASTTLLWPLAARLLRRLQRSAG